MSNNRNSAAMKQVMLGLQFVSQAIDKQNPIQNGFNDQFKKTTNIGKKKVKCNICDIICCEACMGKTVANCNKFGRGAMDLWLGSGKPCSACKHGAEDHSYDNES